MLFYIDTIHGIPEYDFEYETVNAVKYLQWMYPNDQASYITSLSEMSLPSEQYAPVGSIEFVCKWTEDVHKKKLMPINIPPALFREKYLKRHVYFGIEQDAKIGYFAKQLNVFKGITQVVNAPITTVGMYIFSEIIEIVSEWRVFVHHNDIQDIKPYCTDYRSVAKGFPPIDGIKQMIEDFRKDAPIAYTLDIALKHGKSLALEMALLEVHDFFSCGLYGFAGPQVARMHWDWYQEQVIKR